MITAYFAFFFVIYFIETFDFYLTKWYRNKPKKFFLDYTVNANGEMIRKNVDVVFIALMGIASLIAYMEKKKVRDAKLANNLPNDNTKLEFLDMDFIAANLTSCLIICLILGVLIYWVKKIKQ